MSIRVLVVDDSALVRSMLAGTLGKDGDIVVVGAASDPEEARDLIRRLSPDVLTLDIEMPGMNGLAFLQRLMRLRPLPVVMVSTLTHRGAGETLLALELGAVDFVAKPLADLKGGFAAFGTALREKVRIASRATVALTAAPPDGQPLTTAAGPEGAVIAIGASTGGVDAVRRVLAPLPADCPPILITQHMPPGFTARFAARLHEVTGLTVAEAEDRQPLRVGHAYVAPGDRHLALEGRSGQLRCRVVAGQPRSGHCPSVDTLFDSVAEIAGDKAVGIILTGMGRDGAAGLKRMREAGAQTIGQSPGSSLVYGMPRAAFEEGAVVEQLPVERIAPRLAAILSRLPAAA